jgi:hypothetical protein
MFRPRGLGASVGLPNGILAALRRQRRQFDSPSFIESASVEAPTEQHCSQTGQEKDLASILLDDSARNESPID